MASVTDISRDSDQSIVTWYDESNLTQYWYTPYHGNIYMNPNSSKLFNKCTLLSSIDLSGFNTSKVTDMYLMFGYCNKLSSIDVSNFDMSNVTDINNIFNDCYALTSLDLSSWDVSNLSTAIGLFDDCISLTDVKLFTLNTSKQVLFSDMFARCSALTELNLSSLNTSNVISMQRMFIQCTKLTTITYGSNFVLSDFIAATCNLSDDTNRTVNMFSGCPANKPTGGNWDLGTWNSNGTFIKNT